jgi:hypothetical protein
MDAHPAHNGLPQPEDEIPLYRSEAKSYAMTTTKPMLFIKRELADATGLPWLKERFAVEAAALTLLAEKTSIPVPRLVAAGGDEHGLCYLVTEYVPGSVRGDMAALQCRMPRLHRPAQPEARCAVCQDIVRANADRFVRDVVLPQLRGLRSRETGLGGVVIPPRWVSEHDRRESWPVRTSSRAEFVFCHNDLVLHNLVFCTRTLRVLALVDMEDCGYFPPEVQQWKYDKAGQCELYEDMALVEGHIKAIDG